MRPSAENAYETESLSFEEEGGTRDAIGMLQRRPQQPFPSSQSLKDRGARQVTQQTAVPPPATTAASESEKKSVSLSPDRKSFPEKLRIKAGSSKHKISTNASNLDEGSTSGSLEGGGAQIGKTRGTSSSKHQNLIQTHNLTGTLKNLSTFKQDKLTLTTAIKNSNVLKRINLDNRV